MLAYFTHRNTINGLTEAVNGRLEHLRGGALGLRNRANYMGAPPSLDAEGSEPAYSVISEKSVMCTLDANGFVAWVGTKWQVSDR